MDVLSSGSFHRIANHRKDWYKVKERTFLMNPIREPQAWTLEISGAYPDFPRVAVGAVVFYNGRVLLVKRGKPPARGVWAIPGGAVHLGETLQEAAQREILEETGIRIEAKEPIYIFDSVEKDPQGRVRFHYVIIDLAAVFIGGSLRSGDDAEEACWASKEDLSLLAVNEKTRILLAEQFGFSDRSIESVVPEQHA